jgi:hypothetical protein
MKCQNIIHTFALFPKFLQIVPYNHPGILDINGGTKNLNEFEFPAKNTTFQG